MNWTPKQQEVIEARNGDILVSAAAGSGKTTVMVERVMQMITDPDNPIDIDRLLIVTFMRNAASDMKEKIRKRLRKALEEDPDNANLKRQLSLVYAADISTIDSFARKIVSDNFENPAIDIDPNFRNMDEAEENMLFEDTLQEVLGQRYEDYDEDFQKLLDMLSKGKIDDNIKKYIKELMKVASNEPFPREWLERIKDKNKYDSVEELADSPMVQYIIEKIKREVKPIYEDLLVGEADIEKNVNKTTASYEAYESACATTKGILDAEHYDDIRDLIVNYPRKNFALRSAMTQEMEVAKEACKAMTELAKKYHGKAYMETLEGIFVLNNNSQALANVLIDITIETYDKLNEEKKRLSAYSFSDIAHFAIKVLCEEQIDDKGVKHIEPTKVAKELSHNYYEVIIDEYQDSNRIQEYMLSALCHGQGHRNMFMVGDVKQSIYKFRNAEPELFLEKFYSFSDDPESDQRKIKLDSNFRSRPEIINSTNRFFDVLMNKDVGGIDYKDGNRLVYGSKEYEEDYNKGDEDNKTEFHVITQSEGEKAELEARYIADRINKLMDPETGLKITDKKELGRKLEYKDIVVLVRSKSILSTFIKVFEDFQIPSFAENSEGFFSALEIRIIIDFLYVVDNPRQDIPLVSVLKSSVYGFSDTQLAEIRINANQVNKREGLTDNMMYDALIQYVELGENDVLKKKCAEFLKDLKDYRKHSKYMSVYQFINYFLEKTGFDYYVRSLPAGKRRMLNLKLLMEYAYDYESTSYRSLFNFVRFVTKNIENKTKKGEALEFSPEDNVVRLITIHKSKGLEYPVVFVANCNKKEQHGAVDMNERIDKKGNITLDYYDAEQRTTSKSLLNDYVENQLYMEEKAEELRILYVAMTRAKEKLIMVSSVKGSVSTQKKCLEPYDMEKGMVEELRSTDGYYKQMIRVIGNEVADAYVEFEPESKETNIVECKDDIRFYYTNYVPEQPNVKLIEEVPTYTNPKDEIVSQIKANFDYEYPFAKNRVIKAKYSVTELKNSAMRENIDEDAAFFIPDRRTYVEPEFMKTREGETKLSGAKLGTVYHKIFEVLDMDRDYNSIDDVSAFLDELVDDKVLESFEREQIDDSKILAFVMTDLFKDMKDAHKRGQLYREQKFLMQLEASKALSNDELDGYTVLQGIIDAYYIKDGQAVIVDYKTDKASDWDYFKDKYSKQLDLYQDALEKITDYTVSDKIIYSLQFDGAQKL